MNSSSNGDASVELRSSEPEANERSLGYERGPLASHQQEALAHMVVAGLSVSYIARALNRSPQSVRRFMNDADIMAKVQDLQARCLRQVATHNASLMEMLEDCRSVYRDTLRSGDPRLRFDVARHIESRVIPAPTQRTESHVTLEGRVDHEVAGTLKAIAGHVVELREAAKQLQPGRSIRIGLDALSTPTSQIPVDVDVHNEDGDA